MAALIARATGYGKTADSGKSVTRTASTVASASVRTWRSYAEVTMRADGSGSVVVKCDGVTIHEWDIPKEGAA